MYVARKLERHDLEDSHTTHKLIQFASGVTNENLVKLELSCKYKIYFERLQKVSKKEIWYYY